MTLQGVPYKWGGTDPNYGLDCSGLLQVMFAQYGVKIPRVSKDQASFGQGVAAKDARPGDLIAFDWSKERAGIDHIGIYIGNGKMLVAPRTGDVVKVQNVDLNKASTIRRVVPDAAFESIRQPDGKFVYKQGAKAPAKGTAAPTNSGAAADGGDPGSQPTQRAAAAAAPTAQQMVAGTAALPGFGTGQNGKYRPEDYGFSNAFFGSDVELRKLVDRAVKEQWTPEKFAVELKDTKWFVTKSAAEREWTQLNTADPKSARRRVEERAAQIHSMAAQMGADITGLEAHDMAVNSLKFGYSDLETQNAVGKHVEFKRGEPFKGAAGANQDAMKRKAAQYGVPVSDDTLARFVRNIALGIGTEEDFDNWIKMQAKSVWGGLAAQIDQGLTVEDVASLYKATMSQVLEIPDTNIDLLKDPTIKQALSYVDPASKEQAPQAMPLWKFEQQLKKDPRWLQTSNAHDSMMGAGGEVLRAWGLKT